MYIFDTYSGLNAAQFYHIIGSPGLIVLDLRNEQERILAGRIPGTVENIDVQKVEDIYRLSQFPKE